MISHNYSWDPCDHEARERLTLYRLAEENDQFCSTCVKQWKNRHKIASGINPFHIASCHVCGRVYEGQEILWAMPITAKETGECSICCRECYDAIKEMSKELVSNG